MSENYHIVLIGAGSLQFGLGSVGNILNSRILEGSTIILHDIDPDMLDLAYKACKSAIDYQKKNFRIKQTTNREEALKNADFIINAIEIPPRFKLLNWDYQIPLHYGCQQVSGENGGPGGLFHALRVIPPILEICNDIKKICPNAYIFNFSNPMNRICLAVKRKFSNLNFIGLCHEYLHFLPLLEKIVGRKSNELDLIGGGLNHFGIFLKIEDNQSHEDLYPLVKKQGPSILKSIKSYDGFTFIGEFLNLTGYLPYTTDSHYGEYIHWSWKKADIPAIRKFWSSYEKLLSRSQEKIIRKIKQGKGNTLVNPDQERAIKIIEGIVTDANYIEPSVNIPNKNVFTNLPEDLTVECPVLVNKKGVIPMELGLYPKEIASLIKQEAAVQDLVLEAIFQESKDLALQALLADPVVDSYWQAKNILEELLKLESNYISLNLT